MENNPQRDLILPQLPHKNLSSTFFPYYGQQSS